MTRFSRSERHALCDLALEVGEDQPTLCGDWTVKDLVVHLLVREGGPSAVGILVPPLSRLTEAASARLDRQPFPTLVERLRSGPPRLSPFAVPQVDAMVNTLEYFVHHEDVRRARPEWTPRALDAATEARLWSLLPVAGKGLTRHALVGVVMENGLTGSTRVLRRGTPSVAVKGPPSEVALYLFGRADQARVELLGPPDAVARLRDTSLGL